MNYSWRLSLLGLLGVVVSVNCVESGNPNPFLTEGRDIVPDSGTIEDSVASPRIYATHNAYVCYCRWQVPLSCLTNNWWCGLPFTGTTRVDGYCDYGSREARLCFSPALFAFPTLSVSNLEFDCRDRVGPIIGEALRAEFVWCSAACAIRFGCSAIRTDGSAESFTDSRCNTQCVPVPLMSSTADPRFRTNLLTATYIPASFPRPVCRGYIQEDSSQLCRL